MFDSPVISRILLSRRKNVSMGTVLFVTFSPKNVSVGTVLFVTLGMLRRKPPYIDFDYPISQKKGPAKASKHRRRRLGLDKVFLAVIFPSFSPSKETGMRQIATLGTDLSSHFGDDLARGQGLFGNRNCNRACE